MCSVQLCFILISNGQCGWEKKGELKRFMHHKCFPKAMRKQKAVSNGFIVDRKFDVMYPDATLPKVKIPYYFAGEMIHKARKKKKTPPTYFKIGRLSLKVHSY